MARSSDKTKHAGAASSPAKATAGNPANDKFSKAFHQVRNKTFPSSPTKEKINKIAVDYEVLTPLGACLVTFSQHGKSKHAYVYPLLCALAKNAERVYEAFRIFLQAVIFCEETPDHKLKKDANSTINIVGLVLTFDQQEDKINESNIGPNLLKVVKGLVIYANNLALRPFNGETTETFNYRNAFHLGTCYTRSTLALRRHLGQAISPEDSVVYMEKIFPLLTFHEIVQDHDIMTAMYGTMEKGNALVAIARPGFIPNEDTNEDHPNNADHDHDHDHDLPVFVAEP